MFHNHILVIQLMFSLGQNRFLPHVDPGSHVEVETQFEIENVHQITESDVILSEESDRGTGTESGVEVESNIARDDGVEVPSEVEVQPEVEVAMTHAIACPPGYESDVFYSLPEFMQQEILDQHEEENGSGSEENVS